MTSPTGFLFTDPQIKPLAVNGAVQPGAYLQFFLTGTTQPTNVYADGFLQTPLSQTPGTAQPSCTADSAGRFSPIYLDPNIDYRVQLFNAAGVKLEDVDPYVVPLTSGTISQSVIGASLYPITPFENSAQVGGVAVSSFITSSTINYPVGNVLRYGATPCTASVPVNSTPAFNASIAQRQAGGEKVVVPSGLFAVNLTITGYNVIIEGEENYANDVATQGLIAFDNTKPVITIGDSVNGTIATGDVSISKIKMHGNGSGQYGLYIAGAQRVFIDQFSALGFLIRSVYITAGNNLASGTAITDYVFFSNFNIAPAPVTNATGLWIYQPVNYPAAYCTAVYFRGGNLQSAAAATGGCLKIGGSGSTDNATLYLSETYIGPQAGSPIIFYSQYNKLICSNVAIDDGSGGHVLVTLPVNGPVSQYLSGTVSLNGLVSMPAGNTPSDGFGFKAPYRSLLLYPSIAGNIDFQDSGAALNNQFNSAQQPISISRSGNNLSITNTNSPGNNTIAGTSLQLTNGAGSADGVLKYGTTGLQIITSTASPQGVITAPQGSLCLVTNGSSTNNRLWINKDGTTNWTYVTTGA